MPKIISADRNLILDVTRNLINEKRYDEINCRRIAKLCGIGVGTLYHFFPSKIDILAAIIVSDWINLVQTINVNTSLEDGVRNIYSSLESFAEHYHDFWHSMKDISSDYVSNVDKHGLLINQISTLLINLLQYNHLEVDKDVVRFVSEAILTYASKLEDYSKVEKIFIRLLGGK